jgi:hypothetical protein
MLATQQSVDSETVGQRPADRIDLRKEFNDGGIGEVLEQLSAS